MEVTGRSADNCCPIWPSSPPCPQIGGMDLLPSIVRILDTLAARRHSASLSTERDSART